MDAAGKKFLDALQLGGAGEDVTLDAVVHFLEIFFLEEFLLV